MNQVELYLLSIHGTLAPKTIDAARKVHNETAGTPQNIAAARSLGDLSHMVYIPVDHSGPESGEFMIVDYWNSLEGLNKFFADPHVQQGGEAIFKAREPVVWKQAEGFAGYHFPAPGGRNDRIVGIVTGKIRSITDAQQMHNSLVVPTVNRVRAAGCLSHEAYLRLAAPGSPEALEFFAIDTWYDGEGMQKVYEDPDFMTGIMGMFAGEPMATVWVRPAGDWSEW